MANKNSNPSSVILEEAPVASYGKPTIAVYEPSISRGFSQAEAEWINQIASRNTSSPLRGATLDFRPADGAVFQYIGYAGGNGGNPFSDQNILPTGNVLAVTAHWGDYMNSLQVTWQDSDGNVYKNPPDGRGGGNSDIFLLQLEQGEYIKSISGRYGDAVDSMVLTSNLGRQSNFWGGGGGKRGTYVFTAPDGWDIVGFAGRSGDWIDQIGIACRLRRQ